MGSRHAEDFHTVQLYVNAETGAAALHFKGEEDSRLVVTLPRPSADKLADRLRAAGFGSERRR